MCDVSDNNNEANQNNNNYCIDNNNKAIKTTTTTAAAEEEATNSITTTTTNDPNSTTEKLSAKVLNVFEKLARERGIHTYDLQTHPVSGVGENSYGLVLQVKLTPKLTTTTIKTTPTISPPPFVTILKISPKNAARRAHMKVAEYYSREVFMYEKVLHEYRKLQLAQQKLSNTSLSFSSCDIAPEMFYSSLAHEDEFIIFEDLTQQNFTQNSRIKMPTYDLVVTALEALAKLHAMSFILQAKKPKLFTEFVTQMKDNLFTAQIEIVSIEFGKKYVRRTRLMLEEELEQRRERHARSRNTLQRLYVNVLHKIEDNFKDICLNCVDGAANAPYAVICHGDFWNNNILYKYDSDNKATAAKLIDFQMSRYAPPVLDLVHYLFACTEKDLRDAHFADFLQIYYDTLTNFISAFDLNSTIIYPKEVFTRQLSVFGVYGFCMSAFAIPFFISNTSEIPDLDEVSEAIRDLSSASSSSDTSSDDSDDGVNNEILEPTVVKSKEAEEHKCRELVEEYELLTNRTMPIFKRRMTGIVADLVKYNMIENLMKL